jgi:regulator of sigma E protease
MSGRAQLRENACGRFEQELFLMESLFFALQVIFWGLVMFSLIVVIHEAGHFLTARAFGVRVSEFMIGLPGPSIGFKFKGTRFGITPILLGGYALIAGMEGGKENPNLAAAAAYLYPRGKMRLKEVQAASEQLGFDLEDALDVLHIWGTVKHTKLRGGDHEYAAVETDGYALGEPREIADPKTFINAERQQTYRSLSWWKRVVVLAGGVVFNLIFAILVFTAIMLWQGGSQPTTTIESVTDGSPAAVAGIQSGDAITSLDGAPVDSWEGFVTLMAPYKAGDTVELGYEREGVADTASVTLADSDGRAVMGVTTRVVSVPISPLDALGASFGFIAMVAAMIVQLFNPATFGDVVSQSSSVIGVSFEAQRAAAAGFLPFIVLCAALSISIGLMNLLPIPPLDGGKIVVETIERITRRVIPVRVVNGISVVAMALLVMLFLFVTNQDINRYILGG